MVFIVITSTIYITSMSQCLLVSTRAHQTIHGSWKYLLQSQSSFNDTLYGITHNFRACLTNLKHLMDSVSLIILGEREHNTKNRRHSKERNLKKFSKIPAKLCAKWKTPDNSVRIYRFPIVMQCIRNVVIQVKAETMKRCNHLTHDVTTSEFPHPLIYIRY